jgi:hypothetical protein
MGVLCPCIGAFMAGLMNLPDPGALRQQRNRAMTFAGAMFLLGIVATLPASLKRYHALRDARTELLYLQNEIHDMQNEITRTQWRIEAAQRQLAEAQEKAR